MKRFLSILLLTYITCTVHAADVMAIAKAQAVLGQITQLTQKYAEIQRLLNAGTISLDVATPLEGVAGKYVLPFDGDGNMTAWAEKALAAKAGSAVAGKAGEKAAGALAAKVPFGGMAGGLMKNKSKQLGAAVSIGGWDFINENSSHSFSSLSDYSVYLHDQYYGSDDYQKALGAAMAIYPELEKSHRKSVDKAYKDAQKAWKKRR